MKDEAPIHHTRVIWESVPLTDRQKGLLMGHFLLVNIHIYLHLFSWQKLLTKPKLMTLLWQVDREKKKQKQSGKWQ